MAEVKRNKFTMGLSGKFTELTHGTQLRLIKSVTHGGGTAARRDSVRIFRQFVWLEAGSVKAALSRPTPPG